MISLIDTHCHLDILIKADTAHPPTPAARALIATITDEAAAHAVTHIITIGTHLHDSRYGVALAAQNDRISAAIGIHPTELTPHWRADVAQLAELVRTEQREQIVALGECGIDLYHHTASLSAQQQLFRAQIELALTSKLPLIIHSRNAPEETLRVLSEYTEFVAGTAAGIIHCFSYDCAYAQEFIQRGFVLGIGGTLTYPKNHELRTVVQTVPLTALVLETDAPFLAPQEIRGQQNHPREIARIAAYLAELCSISVDTIATTTTATAAHIFKRVLS